MERPKSSNFIFSCLDDMIGDLINLESQVLSLDGVVRLKELKQNHY